jgi:DNA modification methylase
MGFLINKIHNEDCLIGMKKMTSKSIDCVLTSPPYNTSRVAGVNSDKEFLMKNHACRYDIYMENKTTEEYIKWTRDIFNEFDRILKNNGIVLYNISYGSENPNDMWLVIADLINNTQFMVADCIVWKKSSALPQNVSHNKLTRLCEFVFVLCRKTEYMTYNSNKKVTSVRESGQKMYENIFNLIEAPNNDESTNLNKATFSTKLVQKLINIYVKPHSIVLDCFMGTGTTAIGCINSNVNFVGFEISNAQCEYANKRIKQRLKQTSLFDEIDYSIERYV